MPLFVFGVSKGSVLAAGTLWHPAVQAAVLDGMFSTHATLKNFMKKWVSIYVSPESAARAVPDALYSLLSRLTLIYAGWRKKDRFFSAEDFSPRFHKPALFIHAGKDHFASLQDVEEIRSRFRSGTKLWIADGAGHSESVRKHPSLYASEILTFLKAHPGRRAAREAVR
jgi:pimeloyl-ACP methyl ester carboxylesterase